jgi:hypothetical protein
MSGQPVKRLSSLEIDEVSLVDRPANQHGLVTITKRDEGTPMGVYDEHGNELDETRLQSGDQVFNENGEAILLLDDNDLEALTSGELDPAELGLDEDALTAILQEADQDQLVGKGLAAVTGGASTKIQAGKKIATRGIDSLKLGFAHGRGNNRGFGGNESAQKVGAHFGRNAERYGVATAAGTEENVRGRFRKGLSAGEEVLSELSKALTDADQHRVISKVADRVDQAERIAKAAQDRLEQVEAEREFEQFVEIGKSFQLPVDEDELGGILQAVSKVLTDEQLETFERILNTAASALDYEEAGSAGGSPLMAYVGEAAQELVGKSAGEFSEAQATTALFSANDDAYLAYLSENQR